MFSLPKSRLHYSGHSTVPQHDSLAADYEKSAMVPQSNNPAKVFTTILALYEGLDGEVLKGFFSHGITMIVKEAVHRFVIRLYYGIIKLLKRYPSPEQLAEKVKSQAAKMMGQA